MTPLHPRGASYRVEEDMNAQNPVQWLAMAKTVPLTEARARLSELLDELERRHEHVVITRNGRPAAVLVPAEEQEALEETMEILQDEDLLDALRESEEDVQAGRVSTLDEVRRELGLA